ncbi:hypothetical protein [uncultured Bifidobacterium sp.]|uniref:hypothetical protein n=1 Tax=uncultured Bifidobacterium sp. TaxID=165187 RepID=UPI00258457F1|nr:hypothetical protein [uncultured Bifidobacterium sp.]
MTRNSSALGGGIFSIREVEYLESLPAVDRVRNGRIIYNDAFKRECIRRYQAGESPAEIFRSAGLDSSLIGYKRIERSIARWKDTIAVDDANPVADASASLFTVRPTQRWTPTFRRRIAAASETTTPHYIDDTNDQTPITEQDADNATQADDRSTMLSLIIEQQAHYISQFESKLGELERMQKMGIEPEPEPEPEPEAPPQGIHRPETAEERAAVKSLSTTA